MDPFSISAGASFGAGVSFGASVSFRAGLIAPSSAATSAAAATAAATTGGLFLPVAVVAACVGLVTVSVNFLLQALAPSCSKEEVVEVQSLGRAGRGMHEGPLFHGLAAAVKVTPSSTDLLACPASPNAASSCERWVAFCIVIKGFS